MVLEPPSQEVATTGAGGRELPPVGSAAAAMLAAKDARIAQLRHALSQAQDRAAALSEELAATGPSDAAQLAEAQSTAQEAAAAREQAEAQATQLRAEMSILQVRICGAFLQCAALQQYGSAIGSTPSTYALPCRRRCQMRAVALLLCCGTAVVEVGRRVSWRWSLLTCREGQVRGDRW
jgi:hypothetical protein